MTIPTIDLRAICAAFALRFVAATIGTPTGVSSGAMRGSEGTQPKSIPQTPYHYLEVLDGEVVANSQWNHTINVDGVFILGKRPGDPERVDADRQRWLPYLLHATVDQLKLGIGAQVGYTLDKAIPTGWEFTEEEIGATKYDAIRVHWQLWITETVSLTP